MEGKAGMFERLRNLLRMNVNAVIDNAEDPVKALGLLVEDMRKEMADAKNHVAGAITQERLIKRQIDEAAQAMATWGDRAEKALRADREDLARGALLEKAKAKERFDALTPQWEALHAEDETLKEELKRLEDRYQEVLRKKEVLVAKAKVAKARTAAAKAGPTRLGREGGQLLTRAEEKVRILEARADAERELAKLGSTTADAIDQLETGTLDAAVENELAALKKKLSGGP